MIKPPQATAPPKIERVSIMNWVGGYNSTQDDGRIPNDGLTAAQNVLLEQDGVIRPWPSMIEYGPQPSGTILGEIGEFKVINGSTKTNYLITVQNVSGTAHVWIRKDLDAWIECTGKNFDTTADCHFLQIANKVLITNGVDNLSYLDINPTSGSYLDVVPFVSLAAVTGVSATPTGLTGTTYTLRYAVTASNQGETAGTNASAITVSKIRGSWNGTSEYVDITWNRVTNATQYHVYLSDTTGGVQSYLGTVTDPGTGATATFRDWGDTGLDYTRSIPLEDTSAGPIAKRAFSVNGRVFLLGDPSNMRLVRYGGDTPESALDFGPYNGGGSGEIGSGGKEVPVAIKSFRRGNGTPSIVALCQSTAGRGKRYTLTPETLTIGETVISYFKVEEDNGEDGTDSPDGVILYRDSLWYPSLDGFKSTYTKEQVQNILSTDKVSGKIEPDISNISTQNLDKCVGVAYQGRLYWALPVGAEENNQIWTLDLERGRGWMLPRYVKASWLSLYEDNAGKTHFLALSENGLYEFSYSSLTNDNGTAMSTYARSGMIKFSKDGMEWGSVIDVTFVFLRPKGSIEIQVEGLTEDEELAQSVGSDTYVSGDSFAGWGESTFSSSLAWGETINIPSGSNITRKTKTVEIDEELNWLIWSIKTTDPGVDYRLADVIVRYINVGTKDGS